MSAKRQILAAIFDMDGLLIDSEPLWDRAELEVLDSLGVDISRRDELPDLLGLRIDTVVDLWFAQQPRRGPDRAEVTASIIRRAIQLVEESRPLLPGVREAVALCKSPGTKKIGLASASPLHMLEKKCWKCLNYATSLTRWLPPNICHTANLTPGSISIAPLSLASHRCLAWRWRILLTA